MTAVQRLAGVVGTAVAISAMAASGLRAQAATAADQAFFEQHMGDLVQLKPTPLTNPALGKLLQGEMFSVGVVVDEGSTTILADRLGSTLVNVTLPHTEAAMPGLAKLIKPDFRLRTDADAHVLQDALDILYPIEADNAATKTIRHSGTTWTFVRGKFFDGLEGFVYTTDASGKITGVTYSLDLK